MLSTLSTPPGDQTDGAGDTHLCRLGLSVPTRHPGPLLCIECIVSSTLQTDGGGISWFLSWSDLVCDHREGNEIIHLRIEICGDIPPLVIYILFDIILSCWVVGSGAGGPNYQQFTVGIQIS